MKTYRVYFLRRKVGGRGWNEPLAGDALIIQAKSEAAAKKECKLELAKRFFDPDYFKVVYANDITEERA